MGECVGGAVTGSEAAFNASEFWMIPSLESQGLLLAGRSGRCYVLELGCARILSGSSVSLILFHADSSL